MIYLMDISYKIEMTALKNKVIVGWLFIKRKVLENKLRTGAIFCVLLVLVSFFLPFMSAKADVSISGVMNNTLNVITPENSIVTINLGDFVLQKPIDDIIVLNMKLGDVKVFDQSVLHILRNPIPDKGIIGNVDQALNSSALSFLIDPKIQEIIATKLPMGTDINIIMKDTWNIIQGAKSIVGAVNNVTIQARETMGQVNAIMATIDGYKSTANAITFIIFAMGLGLLFLHFYKRARVNIAIGLSSVLFILFLGAGIVISIVNAQVNTQLSGLAGQINNGIVEGLREVLAGTLGDMGNALANFIGTRGDFISMTFYFQLDIGYWFILLGLGGSLVLSIFMVRENKKNMDIELEEDQMKDAMLNELEEIIETIEVEEAENVEVEVH